MTKATKPAGGRVLEPVERLSEILFGLIMAMTFTGAVHVADAGHEEIRAVLVGAIGCNLAWGIVDAVMYVLTDLVERNRGLHLLRALHSAASPERARELTAAALPDRVAEVMRADDLDTLRRRLVELPLPVGNARPTWRTLRGALGVFLLVALSTFPLVLPFVLIQDPVRALRFSHATGLVMLYAIGSALGRYSGQRSWAAGLGMLAVGVVLVALTIVLGG